MVDVRKFNSKLAIVLVLLFAYVTRVWRLSIPADYYFDEVYHAFTARAYANNDPRGYEWWHTAPEGVAYEWLHPPLAKLFQGFSIYILGENSFAWRFPSAVFGVLTVWAVYELTFELSKKKSWAVIAAMIASFDGLLLTLSRIAMNDIFVTFFILMTLKWYFRFSDSRNKNDKCKALFWSSIFAGLALASKWSGIYLLMIVGLWEIYLRWQQLLTNKTIWLLKVCLALVLLVCAGWVLLFLKLESVLYVKYLMTTLLLAIDLVLWVRIFSLKRVIHLSIAFVLVPIAIYWLHMASGGCKDTHWFSLKNCIDKFGGIKQI